MSVTVKVETGGYLAHCSECDLLFEPNVPLDREWHQIMHLALRTVRLENGGAPMPHADLRILARVGLDPVMERRHEKLWKKVRRRASRM